MGNKGEGKEEHYNKKIEREGRKFKKKRSFEESGNGSQDRGGEKSRSRQ